MVFREPKVDFVSIVLDSVIATSGLGAEFCKEVGDPAMTLGQFCTTMTHQSSNTWTEICPTLDGAEDTTWRPPNYSGDD